MKIAINSLAAGGYAPDSLSLRQLGLRPQIPGCAPLFTKSWVRLCVSEMRTAFTVNRNRHKGSVTCTWYRWATYTIISDEFCGKGQWFSNFFVSLPPYGTLHIIIAPSPATQNDAKFTQIYFTEPRRLIITGSVKRRFQGKDEIKVKKAASEEMNRPKLTRNLK